MPDVRSPSEASCQPKVSCLIGATRRILALQEDPTGSALTRASAAHIPRTPQVISVPGTASRRTLHLGASSTTPRPASCARVGRRSPGVTSRFVLPLPVPGLSAVPLLGSAVDPRVAQPIPPCVSSHVSTCVSTSSSFSVHGRSSRLVLPGRSRFGPLPSNTAAPQSVSARGSRSYRTSGCRNTFVFPQHPQRRSNLGMQRTRYARR